MVDIPMLEQLEDIKKQLEDISKNNTIIAPAIVRGIYSGNTVSAQINVPQKIKGFILHLTVHAKTGTFNAGEGIQLEVYLNPHNGLLNSPVKVNTARKDAVMPDVIFWYPGAVKGDAVVEGTGRDFKVCGLPVSGKIQVRLSITGTFTGGQGFDCEANIYWLP